MNEELILKNQRMIMESLRFKTDNEWLQTHLDKQIQETSEHISKLRLDAVMKSVCDCGTHLTGLDIGVGKCLNCDKELKQAVL